MQKINHNYHMFDASYEENEHGARFTAIIDGDEINSESVDAAVAGSDFQLMVHQELSARNWHEAEKEDAMCKVINIVQDVDTMFLEEEDEQHVRECNSLIDKFVTEFMD